MEARPIEPTGPVRHTAESTDAHREAQAWAAVLAVVVAGLLAGAVALVAAATHETAAPEAAAAEPTAPVTSQTAFAIFEEFHATVSVTPAAAGANTIDVFLAAHDGSAAPPVDSVTVSAAPSSGEAAATEYTAEPVEGTPGAYRVADVSLPEEGEWALTLTAVPSGSKPVTKTLLVPIGAP